jgi:hypothetical protein
MERKTTVIPFEPRGVTRVHPEGWVRWLFWGLRIYIVGMLILVIIGFTHGLR